MAQRHAARITNQRRDLVPVLERPGDHEPTREASGAEDGELHTGASGTSGARSICWSFRPGLDGSRDNDMFTM